MRDGERRLAEALERLARPPEPGDIFGEVARRKRARRTVRRVQAAALAVAVVAGSAGVALGLARVFLGDGPKPGGDGAPAGTIVFASDRTGDHEIFVMNEDGSGVQNLTDSPATDVQPAWSPDGSRIAFVSDRGGGFDLYTMVANGGNVARVTRGAFVSAASAVAWSPDGDVIAFAGRGAERGPCRGIDCTDLQAADIFIVRPDGGGLTAVTTGPASDWSPTWAPDGKAIAFVREPANNPSLYLVPIGGSAPQRALGEATPLTTGGLQPSEPAWSPDGRSIAFSYEGRIQLLNLETGRVARLTAGFDPSWASHGELLVFHRRDGHLYSSRPDGTQLKQLTGADGQDSSPGWIPSTDGDVVAVALPRCQPGQLKLVAGSEAVGASVGLILVSVSLGLDDGPPCRVDVHMTLTVTDSEGNVIPFPGNPSSERVRGVLSQSPSSAWLWRPCLPLPQGGAGGPGYQLLSGNQGVQFIWEAASQRVIDRLRIRFEPGCDPIMGSLGPMPG